MAEIYESEFESNGAKWQVRLTNESSSGIECSCNPNESPFHCSRHNCLKDGAWWSICRANPHYVPQRDDNWRRQFDPQGEVAIPPLAPKPSIMAQAWSVATAIGAFIADGFQTVSAEEYARRMQICDGCDRRTENRCSECGCFLAVKAQGRAFTCPLNRWESSSVEIAGQNLRN